MPKGHKLDRYGPEDQLHMSRFTWLQFQSTNYAESLVHPSYLNWVTSSWMWL